MVEKKLNFNQPILSVRKYSPKVASHIVDQREGLPVMHRLPPHRPEMNSGPVRNPGSVPFLWEQSPGRPKEEILAQYHNFARPLVSPEPPPSSGMEALQETSPDFDANSGPVVDEGDDLGTNALVRQQEEERRKVVDQEKAVVLHCRPSFEREGSDQHENVITICCLLPRSCLKSSVCSLNLVPAMSRVMTFPGSRMLCESAASGSSTDSENEYAVIQTYKLNEIDDQQLGPFLEETPCKKSFKTLQELLADDAVRITEREDDSESDVKASGEMKMIEDSDSDLDSSSEGDIRLAVNKAAENARKRLARESVSPPPPPPPLPESPSDSWLSRTLSSTSARKASSSAFMSRLSNKY